MITWADVGNTETGGSFPFRDGRLVITHKEIAIWKAEPTAVFHVARHAPLSGDVQYLPTKWHLPDDMK